MVGTFWGGIKVTGGVKKEVDSRKQKIVKEVELIVVLALGWISDTFSKRKCDL